MLRIAESIDAGTYRVVTEDVATAIMAGLFGAHAQSEASLGERIARLAEVPQRNDHN